MADYIELAELKETLHLAGETFVDDDLRLAITAASNAVDSICGRHFSLDSEDKTRTYRATRERRMEIDDLAEVTTIVSGVSTYQTWATGDYWLLPDNAAADGQPYTSLELRPDSLLCLTNEPGTTIQVTGRFGWPEVPAAVKEATRILAARFIKRVREAPFGVAGMGTDGIAVRISRTDPDVSLLLGPYTRVGRLA